MTGRRWRVLDVIAAAVAFMWVRASARLSRASRVEVDALAFPASDDRGEVAQVEAVAQVQDHAEAPNATKVSNASGVAFVLDEGQGATRPRVLLGPVIDGGTTWSIDAPAGGWGSLIREIRTRVRRGAKVMELPSPGGGSVEVSVELARGALVLWSSSARVEVHGKRAEAQIEARAAWTEGPARWCSRVLPLVSLWLLGVEQGEEPGSSWAWLESIGWRQASVEIAMDFTDWKFDADDHKAFVTKLAVKPWVQGGQCRAIEWGARSRNPSSGALYDKGAALAVLRGDAPAGYLEQLRAAGWDHEQTLTRLELRLSGKALKLLDPETGEVFDGTRPWTACDGEAIGRLATYALQAVWMADLRVGGAERARDNPVHPGWLAARAAALGGAEPIRLTRAAVEAEVGSVRAHARARLLRAGVDVGVLDGAKDIDGARRVALAKLAEDMAGGGAIERFGASRARYRELLEQVREVSR